MDPRIIFEDQALLCIDKPSGMTVNRSETTIHEKTVQDWAEGYLGITKESRVPRAPQISPGDGVTEEYDPLDAFYERAGIVHRLDKETSGLLLIGKTEEGFLGLQKQFKERTMQKTYIALAHGRLLPKTGEIEVPVGRLPWDRHKFGIVAGGREAVTQYTVLRFYTRTDDKQKEPLSLVELFPKTGRTHQIRVHLKYSNHPIFSDPLYSGRKTMRKDRQALARLFLHAAKLTLMHPVTHLPLSLESDLPSDLAVFVASRLVEIE